MSRMEHWDHVYASKKPTDVSWYRPHLDLSLRLIAKANPDPSARLIDVGGGESTLVDDLLTRGYRNVTVLDLSATAIRVAKARLGAAAGQVTWVHADVTTHPFAPRSFDIWHDRAVFHFLTERRDRVAYVAQVARAVKPGGHVIVATFGPEGPTHCSGLEVVRYEPAALHSEFGAHFQLIEHLTEAHHTPAGKIQQFIYCYCKVLDPLETNRR